MEKETNHWNIEQSNGRMRNKTGYNSINVCIFDIGIGIWSSVWSFFHPCMKIIMLVCLIVRARARGILQSLSANTKAAPSQFISHRLLSFVEIISIWEQYHVDDFECPTVIFFGLLA